MSGQRLAGLYAYEEERASLSIGKARRGVFSRGEVAGFRAVPAIASSKVRGDQRRRKEIEEEGYVAKVGSVAAQFSVGGLAPGQIESELAEGVSHANAPLGGATTEVFGIYAGARAHIGIAMAGGREQQREEEKGEGQ